MSTMQSKLVDGLYLCGELLDVDGMTGGYNFQSAWTSGYIAGSSAGYDISR
jgi:predicted flavoprotein YhiN